MRLSEERVTHIAHLVSKALWGDDLVDFESDERALTTIKDVMRDYLTIEDAANEAARDKIESLSKNVLEGTSEWNTLYRQYLDEELSKKRF